MQNNYWVHAWLRVMRFSKSPFARTIAGHTRINLRVLEEENTRRTRNEIGRYANSLCSVTLTYLRTSSGIFLKKILRPFPFSATPRYGVNGDVAPCQNVLEIVLLARPGNLGFFLANNHAWRNLLELFPPWIFHEWKMKTKNWNSIWQAKVGENLAIESVIGMRNRLMNLRDSEIMKKIYV